MSFVYDLDEEAMSDLPTIVRRSKEDCPPETELVLGRTHADILARLTKVMVYYHEVLSHENVFFFFFDEKGPKAYKKLRKKEKKDQQALQDALKREKQSLLLAKGYI